MIHLLFEGGNKDLKNRKFPLPKGVRKYLVTILNNYNGDKDVEGYKRLNNILEMNGIKYQEMKRLKNYFDNFQGDIHSDEYILNGGDAIKTWVNNTLNTATNAIRGFKQAKKDAGISNAFIKPHEKDRLTHGKMKPTISKFQTHGVADKMSNNNAIKYEATERKTIYLSEEQIRLIREAQDDTFSLEELSSITSFKGRYNYCIAHIGSHVGKGSSRATFQLDDSKVLKLAINEKGIAQNGQEGRNDYYLQQLGIVPEIYDTDDNDKWIITEYVLPAKAKDFKECLGIDEQTFYHFLLTSYVKRKGNKYERMRFAHDMLDDATFNELAEDEDLMNWDDYIGSYDISIGDMLRRCNYGMALRGGYPTIVLLDNGLTYEIYNDYYSKR